jgi:hypothetical protein
MDYEVCRSCGLTKKVDPNIEREKIEKELYNKLWNIRRMHRLPISCL